MCLRGGSSCKDARFATQSKSSGFVDLLLSIVVVVVNNVVVVVVEDENVGRKDAPLKRKLRVVAMWSYPCC